MLLLIMCLAFKEFPGSVLSPFLFTLYLVDVSDLAKNDVKFLLDADVIVVYAQGSNAHRTRRKFQITLYHLRSWLSETRVSISPDKSVAINASRKHDIDPLLHIHSFSWDPPTKK